MFNSKAPMTLKVAVAAGFISALAFSPIALAEEHSKDSLDASASKEITGEVVDMMCYVDHNAMGDKHSGCAAKCIKGMVRSVMDRTEKAISSSANTNQLKKGLASSAGK